MVILRNYELLCVIMLLFCDAFLDAPRVVQCTFDLPLSLICFGCAPVKQAQHKVWFLGINCSNCVLAGFGLFEGMST